MTKHRASPRNVAKSTLHTKSESLRAAAEALKRAAEQPEPVTVPRARGMTVDTFRLHLAKRHPRVHAAFFTHHDMDHRTNQDLDHIHEEEKP